MRGKRAVFVGRDEKRAPLKTPAWEATSQPTIAFFAAVSHLNGPLRKQNFTSRVEKVMVCDLWISIRFVCFSVSRFVACDRNYD